MFFRHRRIVWPTVSAVCSLFFLQCGDSSAPVDNSTPINQGIQSLAHLEQIQPFDERPDSAPDTNTYDLAGRTYECREQWFAVAAKFDDNIALNPTSDILWPGAIIDGASVATGSYVPIIVPRAPLTFSVSLVNIAGAKSRTVQDPKLSTMRNAMAELLTQEVTGATDARVTFEISDIHSASQLDIALRASYDNGLNDVKGQFDFSRTDVLSRTVVKFMQVYYTIDVDIPQYPSDFFAPTVTWATLRSGISGNVSPMYISTIAYGRMALFTIESSYSSTEVNAAVQATFNAINTNVDLSTGYKTVLQQSSIKGMIIGGSGAEAVQAVNGFDGMKQYMTTGGNYDQNTAAAPLAYKLRYLSDNVSAEVVKAQTYLVKTCEELKPGRYGVRNTGAYVAWFYVVYDFNGANQQVGGDDITWGTTRAYDVPAKATNVWVRVRYSTGVSNQDIFRYPGSGSTPRPEVKCWHVWGEIYATHYEEYSTCDF